MPQQKVSLNWNTIINQANRCRISNCENAGGFNHKKIKKIQLKTNGQRTIWVRDKMRYRRM